MDISEMQPSSSDIKPVFSAVAGGIVITWLSRQVSFLKASSSSSIGITTTITILVLQIFLQKKSPTSFNQVRKYIQYRSKRRDTIRLLGLLKTSKPKSLLDSCRYSLDYFQQYENCRTKGRVLVILIHNLYQIDPNILGTPWICKAVRKQYNRLHEDEKKGVIKTCKNQGIDFIHYIRKDLQAS